MRTLLGAGQGDLEMERVAEVALRHLGVDLVVVTEIADGVTVHRAAAGSLAVTMDHVDRTRTYTRLLVDGLIPNVISDTSVEPLVSELEVTRVGRIGAFIGVPLRRSDGSDYGAICGINHAPDPSLDARDVRFLSLLAELLAPELDEQRRREQLRIDLVDLIETGRVSVAYQPIIDARSRRCIGVEALARFPKPFDGPHETFVAAYEVGLGFELERLIVRKTWSLLEQLGCDQFLALNLTPQALLRLASVAVHRDDIDLSNLVVEMTEHAVVDDYDTLRAELAPLRARGLRIGIDDAGAGYSSLRHVVELQPDVIKIDRSLVNGVADDRARRVAIGAFVLLAMDLGATVIGEGVERPQDLTALADLGVQAAQGFLLARPTADPEALGRWVSLRGRPAPLGPCEDVSVQTLRVATQREEVGSVVEAGG